MEKTTKYFSVAALANGLQLLLCLLIVIIGNFINIYNPIVSLILFVLQIAIWLICGFKLATSGDMNRIGKLLLAVFIALFPILIYTSTGYLISKLTEVTQQNWTYFFFIGGPVIFYNKPATFLMTLFKGKGYMLVIANYIIISISYMFGEFVGYNINSSTRKRKSDNKKAKREAKENKKEKRKAKKNKKKKEKDIAKDMESPHPEKEISEEGEKELDSELKNDQVSEDINNDNDNDNNDKNNIDSMIENIIEEVKEENIIEE